MDIDRVELTQTFLCEAREHLELLDQYLLEMEKADDFSPLVAKAFRSAHSIKGCAGLLGFSGIENVAHHCENLLNHIRDSRIKISKEVITSLFGGTEAIRTLVESVANSSQEICPNIQDVVNEIKRLCPGEDPTENLSSTKKANTFTLFSPDGEDLREPKMQTEKSQFAMVRVSTIILGKLMDLIGELVLTRNELVQTIAAQEYSQIASLCQRLSQTTTALQENILKARLQPLSSTLLPFKKMIRDLAIQTKKEVDITFVGMETELDREIIEAIKDPLTHIIRNSVAHGIEYPHVRARSNKNQLGMIEVKVYSNSSYVVIEIRDDGAGIDPKCIKRSAVERKLISPQIAESMSDAEAQNLIFVPGFSTAETVTNLCGRGVGMDVVKYNIEKLGGHIEIQSEVGRGTSIKLKLPLTLSIIPALIIRVGTGFFAIPQSSLVELIQTKPQSSTKEIDFVGNQIVYHFRGSLIPIVFLHSMIGIEISQDIAKDSVQFVVLQSAGGKFGLVVDQIVDTTEIVIKPLGQILKNNILFSGAAVLGDRNIALVLSADGLASALKMRLSNNDVKETNDLEDGDRSEKAFLIAQTYAGRTVAVPIADVIRLEKISPSAVESSLDGKAIQWGNQILPINYLDNLLFPKSQNLASNIAGAGELLQTVIVGSGDLKMGLVVKRFVDIISHRKQNLDERAMVAGHITQFLNVKKLLSEAS